MRGCLKRRAMLLATLLVYLMFVSTVQAEVANTAATLESAAKPLPTANKQPRYRLVLGKGTSVCESYLKHLNAFPLEEPAMICERKLHSSFKNLAKPKWEEIDLWQHLDWVYEIDYFLLFPSHPNEDYYAYIGHGKKTLTFEEWLKDYEARTRAKGIKPRLYRATLTIQDWATPVQMGISFPPLVEHQRVWLAYDKGYDRCLDSDNERLALADGGLYNVFMLNENATHIDPMAFNSWPGSKQETDLLIYRGRTYFSHVLPGADFNKNGTLFIAKPRPPYGAESTKYLFDDTCRIDFTYGNTR